FVAKDEIGRRGIVGSLFWRGIERFVDLSNLAHGVYKDFRRFVLGGLSVLESVKLSPLKCKDCL
nr:hypothetical protein [Tanacetum cinerariifolium]